jgi:hypothetical protein
MIAEVNHCGDSEIEELSKTLSLCIVSTVLAYQYVLFHYRP